MHWLTKLDDKKIRTTSTCIYLLSFFFSVTVTSLLMLLNCLLQVTGKLAALKGLDARLQEIRSYLDLVINEKLPLNHEILYHLQVIWECTLTLHLCSPAHPHPLSQK